MTGQSELGFLDGLTHIAGVDEVGRGPLAGPVVAAAVILDPSRPVEGLRDSKQLSPARREELSVILKECVHAWAIGFCTPAEIDEHNILQASMLAMRRAIEALQITPQFVQVDGNRCPEIRIPSEAIIGGDDCVPCISAASIIAKVYRDAEMVRLHEQFPMYGFDRNKGYPTSEHLAALDEHGATIVHRRSFAPVRNCLARAAL
ncbi:MAG TPA: ribonuclease HII [Gammaproteobacteria bacterium]